MTTSSASGGPERIPVSGSAPGPGPGSATLRRLLAFDDAGTLRLLLAPADPDPTVHDVVFGDWDGLETAHGTDGRLVLAVGPPAASPGAAGAVHDAARHGACAVVLRDTEGVPPAPEVLAAARETGLALLARAAWTDWGDTASLLRSALALSGAGPDSDSVQAAHGDGLDTLASAIAAYTGGSITIEDTAFRVLAHSATLPGADGVRRSTILGGRVPEARVAELRRSGLLRTLWTSRDVIRRPARGDSPERLVVAVRNGSEVLGSIWAAADGRSLSPHAEDALRRAADAAAPHLIRHRLRESGAVRRRDDALRGLLYGRGDARTHAWSLGLATDAPCTVVIAEHVEGSEPSAVHRTLDVLTLQAASYRAGALVLREAGRLLVLLPAAGGQSGETPGGGTRGRGVPGGGAQESEAPGRGTTPHEVSGRGVRAREVPGRAALGLARELASLAASLPGGTAVRAGAGPVVASALRAADACEEAASVVRVLRERERRGPAGEPPVRYAGPAEVSPGLGVLRILDAVRPLWESGSGPVHDLVRTDLEAGGALVRSLGAYLDASGDVARAAGRLVVHPNTLRYRLRRAQERYGVDLDDPDTRLLLTLAVRLTGDV
ncbi:helix-turn-helix domain-containing protein [Streptomyces sp. NBC_01754]|nr:helix-turn-helix domain-containing protein [Streptomyces sp. NBC_01754]WSC96292.1 helix-turn-helix domain-containing protein [Streptomyces sp. NBC_01754]